MPRPSPQTDRVVALTTLLAAHPDQAFTLAELGRRLHLNKATAYPMVAALAGAGWLVRDAGAKGYRLGPALVSIGDAAGRSFPVVTMARPAMVELSHRHATTCAAFVPSGDHLTLAEQVWDVRSTVPPLRVGQRLPVRAPFGALFAAWGDAAVVDRWVGDVGPEVRRRYERSLGAIRERGFVVELHTSSEDRVRDRWAGRDDDLASLATAVDELVDELATEDGYLPSELAASRYDVTSIAAPVFDHGGSVCLALALLGFAASLSPEALSACGRDLVAATSKLTRALGGPFEAG